jgi:hypothetical protein
VVDIGYLGFETQTVVIGLQSIVVLRGLLGDCVAMFGHVRCAILF